MDTCLTQGQRIRHRRLQCRFTQEYVADRLGTTKQAIYKYEADLIKNIPTDKLLGLAQLLQCSPAWLQGLPTEADTALFAGLPEPTPPSGAAEFAASFAAISAPPSAPSLPDTEATADAQITFYRDLMDSILHLTATEREMVLQFSRFLAAQHSHEAK